MQYHKLYSLSADSKGGAPTADLTWSLLFRINRNWNWFISWGRRCCWIRLYETFFPRSNQPKLTKLASTYFVIVSSINLSNQGVQGRMASRDTEPKQLIHTNPSRETNQYKLASLTENNLIEYFSSKDEGCPRGRGAKTCRESLEGQLPC